MYECLFVVVVFFSVVHMLFDTCIIPDKLTEENVTKVEETVIIH